MSAATGRPQAPSVFVSVGTDHHPFDRLIAWIDAWVDGRGTKVATDCFVQYGTSRPPSVVPGAAYLPHDETHRRITTAAVVVCHGGPGTIVDCVRSGTKPIVVPRRHDLGEHVDDHQVRFTGRLEEAGYVKVATSASELGALVERALTGSPEFAAAETGDTLRVSIERFATLVEPLLRRRR